MKICSFFCVGAVMYKTGKQYVHEIDGFGRRMPVVFGIFTIASLGLMGVPGLAGFISKWNLASAAVMSDNVLAYVGIGALLVSALLTAIYMLSIVIRAFFPYKEKECSIPEETADPGWMMLVPLCIFAGAIIYFGLHSAPIVDFFTQIAGGNI